MRQQCVDLGFSSIKKIYNLPLSCLQSLSECPCLGPSAASLSLLVQTETVGGHLLSSGPGEFERVEGSKMCRKSESRDEDEKRWGAVEEVRTRKSIQKRLKRRIEQQWSKNSLICPLGLEGGGGC